MTGSALMLDDLQAHLGHVFHEPLLLEEAITHRSYLNEHADYPLPHNERLEFLGDAVVGIIASDFLFRRFPEMPEGRLTRLRAWLVRTETLALFASQLGLGAFIRMAKGEADSGGRERQTILCNTFEAVIGALYLDAGLEYVTHVVLPMFEPVLVDVLASQREKDAKSLFQEWSQAIFNITPTYQLVAAVGEEHTLLFVVELLVGEIAVGWGNGSNKQLAEQAAAEQALAAARSGQLNLSDTADLASD